MEPSVQRVPLSAKLLGELDALLLELGEYVLPGEESLVSEELPAEPPEKARIVTVPFEPQQLLSPTSFS